MPVFADHTLPAVEALAGAGVDILPIGDAPAGALRIGLLNLMPLKEMAETDMLRVLSATDLPVAFSLISLRTHVPRHTSAEHMAAHYTPYSEGMERSLDGFIINGAPLERVAFRDVSYWPEITMIFDSLRRNHTPSLGGLRSHVSSLRSRQNTARKQNFRSFPPPGDRRRQQAYDRV